MQSLTYIYAVTSLKNSIFMVHYLMNGNKPGGRSGGETDYISC